ncbi:uncharacterized protein TrAtP1_010433 [Trichoderma atroviride]|uniref:uncharacterized protein n=1 Tax=Hypocrea atroviridis TaxID=63577 RepID=UPI00331B84E2|nr:hypothetical protein TrAtP1_010433 [Trichoderma atroviride]
MSPQLKELLLPQFVQDRKSSAMDEALEGCDLSYVYYTTDSSSSDIASPLTPTFSNRGGVPLRYSSSTSSLELPALPQEGPASPIAQHAAASKSSIRQLPDVQEEPLEREQEYDEEEYDDDDDNLSDTFGMYCLCDQACEHQDASRELLRNEITGEYDIDYDMGFLSDSDFSGDAQFSRKKRHISGEALAALSSRIGSRFPSIARWTSQRKANSITGLMASPTTERSLENVLSGAESSRSSSMSSPARQFPVLLDDSSPMPPPAMPFYESTDSLDMHAGEFSREERSGIERDRAMATTPPAASAHDRPARKASAAIVSSGVAQRGSVLGRHGGPLASHHPDPETIHRLQAVHDIVAPGVYSDGAAAAAAAVHPAGPGRVVRPPGPRQLHHQPRALRHQRDQCRHRQQVLRRLGCRACGLHQAPRSHRRALRPDEQDLRLD